MKIITELSVLEYIALVNALVSDFFSDDGEYTPHLGEINSIRLFYNFCVKEFPDAEKISIQDSYDIDKIMSNKEFVQEYNKAISYGKKKIGIDFGNAYWNAKGIVAQKKTSTQMIIDVLKNIIKTAGKLSDNLSQENIKEVSEIAKQISENKFNEDVFTKMYENTERFSNIMKTSHKSYQKVPSDHKRKRNKVKNNDHKKYEST